MPRVPYDPEQQSSSASPDKSKRTRSKLPLSREIFATPLAKIWSRQIKPYITRLKSEGVKDEQSGKVYRHRSVRVPAITRGQFFEWTNPNAPSYNPQIVEAIKHGEETDDWEYLRDLCRKQRKALFHREGLSNQQGEADSNHELVVSDIFTICGIPFTPHVDVPDPDHPDRPLNADFLLGDGRLLEIFGVRHQEYRDRAEEKTQKWRDRLWYLLLIHVSVEAYNVQLLGYARCLDEHCFHKDRHDLPLFANVKVEDMLKEKVPLLVGKNIELARNYLIQLHNMGAEGRDAARQRINEHYVDQETGEWHGPQTQIPKYVQPNKAYRIGPEWRDEDGREIPLIRQIRRVNPTALSKQPRPEAPPLAVSAQVKMEQPKQALGLEEISAALHQEFDSVDMWSDEEKVALYFRTPKAIMEAMRTMGRPQQPMRMVARNWYENMRKIA